MSSFFDIITKGVKSLSETFEQVLDDVNPFDETLPSIAATDQSEATEETPTGTSAESEFSVNDLLPSLPGSNLLTMFQNAPILEMASAGANVLAGMEMIRSGKFKEGLLFIGLGATQLGKHCKHALSSLEKELDAIRAEADAIVIVAQTNDNACSIIQENLEKIESQIDTLQNKLKAIQEINGQSIKAVQDIQDEAVSEIQTAIQHLSNTKTHFIDLEKQLKEAQKNATGMGELIQDADQILSNESLDPKAKKERLKQAHQKLAQKVRDEQTHLAQAQSTLLKALQLNFSALTASQAAQKKQNEAASKINEIFAQLEEQSEHTQEIEQCQHSLQVAQSETAKIQKRCQAEIATLEKLKSKIDAAKKASQNLFNIIEASSGVVAGVLIAPLLGPLGALFAGITFMYALHNRAAATLLLKCFFGMKPADIEKLELGKIRYQFEKSSSLFKLVPGLASRAGDLDIGLQQPVRVHFDLNATDKISDEDFLKLFTEIRTSVQQDALSAENALELIKQLKSLQHDELLFIKEEGMQSELLKILEEECEEKSRPKSNMLGQTTTVLKMICAGMVSLFEFFK